MQTERCRCLLVHKLKLRVDEQTCDHFYATEQNLLQVLVDSYRVASAYAHQTAADFHSQ